MHLLVLGAFFPWSLVRFAGRKFSLNAPSGVGCFLTSRSRLCLARRLTGLNAPCGAGCFLTPASGNGVVAPLLEDGAPPAPQAPRGTGQHRPYLTTFRSPDAKRHRRPSGTFGHQLPTTSSQKVDVPDCDYRHVLLPLSVRQGFGSLGWSAQGDRRETALMLLAGVRGAFCRQD